MNRQWGIGYSYDAEGPIPNLNGVWSYVYGGDGRRVEKTNGSTGKLYWIGAGGEVLAESDLAGGPL